MGGRPRPVEAGDATHVKRSRDGDMTTAPPPNPAPPAAAAAPDWAAVERDVVCPLCDYDLRGLAEPRCPECGYRFEWPDLTDPTRRKHRYLFEHHPERNVWSFVRTALGGLVPWRFWRSLRPEQPSNLRRLLLYWMLTACGVLTIHVGVYAVMCAFYNANNSVVRPQLVAQLRTPQGQMDAQRFIRDFGSVQGYLDHFAPVAPSRAFFRHVWRAFRSEPHTAVNTAGVACFFALPWVAALSLMLFQTTMRRARVRGAHVLRCCLYSFDGGWWFGLAVAVFFALAIGDALRNPNVMRFAMALPNVLGMAAAALVISGFVKLLFAYRLYMRFPHTITTVILAMTVALLLLATVVVNVPGLEEPLLEVWRSL
jgi:hypothetical protein